MKVMVIGPGGREQALAYSLALSDKVTKVFLSPGINGVFLHPKIETTGIMGTSYLELAEYSIEKQIDLAVVGPDQALADGVVDLFESKGIKIFGPSKNAAQIESSKSFAKSIMKEAQIPTASFSSFTSIELAFDFIEKTTMDRMVVKKDGLALGKGVVVCENKKQAKEAVQQFLVDDKAEKIIIEEALVGKELSYFALCDGNDFITLGHACDYKRIRDGNLGPNTGGMGAYAPVDWIGPEVEQEIEKKVIAPLIKVMKKKGIPFKGCLFVGVMMTSHGPKVLEFNVRLGDPEAQTILPLLDEDLFELLLSTVNGELKNRKERKVKLKDKSCVHLVMASYGYPGTEGISVRKGDEIKISKDFCENEKLFFAGVEQINGKILTNGGRVLGLSAIANNREFARGRVYQMAKSIYFKGMQYRKDIAE